MADTATSFSDWIKIAGTALTAASGAAYACGFLVARARAHALGTDPGFALLDQSYVFAGFRFVVLTLLSLLFASPLILLAHRAGRAAAQLRPRARLVLEAIASVLLAFSTIVALLTSFSVQDVLLQPPGNAPTPMARALAESVLGTSDLGIAIIILTTALAACGGLWLTGRRESVAGQNTISALIVISTALLCFLLPVQHGLFLADRKARELERVPDGVTGLQPPLWLVDRGAGDRAVILSRQPDGRAKLTGIKADKLDGIAVVRVVGLADIVRGARTP